jgi:hypothetical protein
MGAALLLGVSGAARGQHSLPELEEQLGKARARLTTVELAPDQRVSLLRQVDDLERRLIAAAPADDRLPTWLADRAACALDLAGEEGADAAVLFGIPTAAQRKTVHTRGREAMELAKRAEQAAVQVVARLEAQLVDRRNPEQAKARAAAIEASLHTLVDVEQGERIPHLRAVGRLLSGATSSEPSERDDLQTAAKELGAIGGAGAEVPEGRRVYIGIALGLAAAGNADRAEELTAAAVAQLGPIAGNFKDGGTATENGAAIRARLGLMRMGKDAPVRGVLASAAQEGDLKQLEVEARAAGLFERAQRENGARVLLVGSAVKLLLDGVEGAEEPERLRVYEKISAALPTGVSLDRLPPEATLARAIWRIREATVNGGAGAMDALAREDAVTMLDALVKRSDASDVLRGQARWEKAVILGAAGDAGGEVDALAAYLSGGSGGTTEERAGQAARRIADVFAKQQVDGALPDAWRARSGAMRDALAILLRTDAANADRWRQESARLSIGELAVSPTAEAMDRALATLETLPATSEAENTAKALSEAVAIGLEGMRTRAVIKSDTAGMGAAKGEWEAVVPRASRALAWARAREAARVPAMALVLGEARVGAQDVRALETLSELVGGAVDQPGGALWSRYRLALARAQRLAGQDAAALTTLRDLADRLEGAPGSAARDPAYWAAWSDLLTILQTQNADKARSPDIRIQIKRLELLDAKLGGSPYAERIRAVRGAVGE